MKQTTAPDAVDFIDDVYLKALVEGTAEDPALVREVIAKSMEKKTLSIPETAALLAAESPDLVEELFSAARRLKRDVYGNRIVIFAPLYVGNECVNDCRYCAFRSSNKDIPRKTLTRDELTEQVIALENAGHKRLIMVYGEHPRYTPEFIAQTVRRVYEVKTGHGEIRRVNINAAPMDTDGYKIIKDAGIGTYQIFQETYHHKTYEAYHPKRTRKGDYLYRLDGLNRAYEAGCDDVGIGALFGLYNWKFEVLGLVSHARFLMDRYGCGPHTISFPRLRTAHGVSHDSTWAVSDAEFKRLVAVLRLAVPYTGMILTAREPAEIRRQVMEFGVSQIDAGTRIELAGYTRSGNQELNREQFEIGDVRSLDEIILDLLNHDFIPSFCTACYRKGRTGEQFMEFAIPGFIEKFCTPNAILTLAEYLEDYAGEETRQTGLNIIEKECRRISSSDIRNNVQHRLGAIRNRGIRDSYL